MFEILAIGGAWTRPLLDGNVKEEPLETLLVSR
jgi:hypothetical protein